MSKKSKYLGLTIKFDWYMNTYRLTLCHVPVLKVSACSSSYRAKSISRNVMQNVYSFLFIAFCLDIVMLQSSLLQKLSFSFSVSYYCSYVKGRYRSTALCSVSFIVVQHSYKTLNRKLGEIKRENIKCFYF